MAKERKNGKSMSIVDTVTIEAVREEHIKVKIVGSAPLLMHALPKSYDPTGGPKGGAKKPRPPIDYAHAEREFLGAMHVDGDGHMCMPAMCFKNAMLACSRFLKGLSAPMLKMSLFVHGDTIKITHKGKPIPKPKDGKGNKWVRMHGPDMVRLKGRNGQKGAPWPRWRPLIPVWDAELLLSFDPAYLNRAHVVSLLNRAGFSNGIGEKRPQQNGGSFGTFKVLAK